MKHLQLAALLLLSLVACNKESDPEPTSPNPPAVQRKLKGYTYKNDQYLPLTIAYDAQGRVVKMDDGEDVSTLVYSGNEVQVTTFRKAENREVASFKGKINSNGQLTEGTGTASYTGTLRQEKHRFEYNSEGYMTRRVLDLNNGENIYEYFFSYANGNLTAWEVHRNGQYDYSGAWEYDLSTQDRSGLNWNHFDVCNAFTGKTNKNLAVKYTGYRDGKVSWFGDFQYTFDAQGYPLTNAVQISNGNAYTLIYQY